MAAGTLTKADEKKVQKHLEAIDQAKLDMVNGAVSIGRELLGLRETIDSSFIEFVESECGFSKSTAYRYMEVAERFGNFPKLGHFQDSALYVLAKCEPAAQRAKELANRGTRITHELAKQLVEEARVVVDAASTHVDQSADSDGDFDASPIVDSDSGCRPDVDETDDMGRSVPKHVVPTLSRKHPEDQSAEKPRPFAQLPPMPPDVNDAFESFKLSILRHKLGGWVEITPREIVDTLNALKQMALAPSE